MALASSSLLPRIVGSLERRKWWWFGAWWLHCILMHWYLLGFITWDAMGYRGLPIIELAQHGDLGDGKYLDWAQMGHVPFVELANAPFVKLFGMRGFLLGLPLVVFPLCVVAVYRLVLEVTENKQSAMFGAFAYCAIPLVNQQPFSGYVDFAVGGILAFFVYAVLRARQVQGGRELLRIAVASVMLGLARAQGMYIALFLLPFLLFVLFCDRRGWRIRVRAWKPVLVVSLAVAVGCVPSIGIQIHKYLAYGSPFAPMQFQAFGLRIGTGMPMEAYWKFAGLAGSDWLSLLAGSFRGWIWSSRWPLGGFFDSRFLGGGLVFDLALVLLPVAVWRMTRLERWLLAMLALASFASKDFALPRYSYELMIMLPMIIGRAMTALLDGAGRLRRVGFGIGFAVLCVHLLRPELDVLQVRSGWVAPRFDVARSRFFLEGADSIPFYGDRGLHLVVIDFPMGVNRVFGRKLTNEVVESIPSAEIKPGCEALQRFIDADPTVMFVDVGDATAICFRECDFTQGGYCGAWKVHPGRIPTPEERTH